MLGIVGPGRTKPPVTYKSSKTFESCTTTEGHQNQKRQVPGAILLQFWKPFGIILTSGWRCLASLSAWFEHQQKTVEKKGEATNE